MKSHTWLKIVVSVHHGTSARMQMDPRIVPFGPSIIPAQESWRLQAAITTLETCLGEAGRPIGQSVSCSCIKDQKRLGMSLVSAMRTDIG